MTITPKRKIVWEKYENVINQGVTNFKNVLATKIPGHEDVDDTDYSPYDEDEDDDDDYIPMIRVPITSDLVNSVKIATVYDCWYAHTNFPLRHSIVEELDNVNGIEWFRIMSKYRFLVAIGKGFEMSDVRTELQERLGVGL